MVLFFLLLSVSGSKSLMVLKTLNGIRDDSRSSIYTDLAENESMLHRTEKHFLLKDCHRVCVEIPIAVRI